MDCIVEGHGQKDQLKMREKERPLDFLANSNIIETAPNCACRFVSGA